MQGQVMSYERLGAPSARRRALMNDNITHTRESGGVYGRDLPLDPLPDTGTYTDLGNAARLAYKHGDRLRWSRGREWWEYDGMRWRSSSTVSVKRLAIEVIRVLRASAEGLNHQPLDEWVQKSQENRRFNAMVDLAKSVLEIADETFDADPGLFNTTTGTVDLRTGKIHAHQAEDFLTRVAGCGFDVEAECPTWESFLDVVFAGDTELIGYVQRAVGMTLLGYTSEQVLFLLYGTGANGKTTFIEALHGVLGEYAVKTPIGTFMKRRAGSATNDLARLAGTRMVSAVESDFDQSLAEGMVKAITGSDTLTARLLYKEYFEFRPEFTPYIATNHLPTISGTDYGIWRRMKVIPFTVTIAPAEQDHDLLAKLEAEGPGILRWAVDGALSYQERGLDEPESITSTVDSYRQDQDPIGLWIDAECERVSAAWTPTSHLGVAYNGWAAANGYRAEEAGTLTRRLSERGLTPKRRRVAGKQVRGWAGIAIIDGDLVDPLMSWSGQ